MYVPPRVCVYNCVHECLHVCSLNFVFEIDGASRLLLLLLWLGTDIYRSEHH